jgi:hypothetical protein
MTDTHVKSNEARVFVTLDVHDPVELHRAATTSFLAGGGTPTEAEQWLGSVGRPNVDACIQEIHHRPSAPGTTTVSEQVTVVDPTTPVLRQGTIVFASTGNITAQELDRINEAFGIEEVGNGVHRCLDDIRHDGLFVSPKHAGFIVRIPGDDFLDEVLEGLTPEMRALVEAAVRQKATRIDFDADEEYADGFHEG